PDSLLSLTSISAPVSNGSLKELNKINGKVNGLAARIMKQKQLASTAAKFVSENEQTISYVRDEIFYATDFKILKYLKPLIEEAKYDEVIRESTIPMLLIEGEHDFMTESKLGKKAIQDMLHLMENNYPKVHQLIRGVGHIPSLDDPQTFNQIVGEFVRSIS
ncbi:MAG: alpha/beta hydrolase, partial [Bacteroidota bacterium]